ncbi:hypothetical protein ACLB6G_02295 [Zhengella sp. ZM62]|uniref:hypothetical protein n=1 Tax=Zhengella sedimenti TaxID=3390035 RepID=UPI003976788F
MDHFEALPLNIRIRTAEMKARMKRKPDFRRIRPTQTYSILELAKAVRRNPATVRKWLRSGMPTLDGLKPKVIDGAQAKEWLRHKWKSRKTPTRPGEAYCPRCRRARPFAGGSKLLKQLNTKVLTITGKCASCGCRMNKFASAKSVALFDNRDETKRANSAA